MTEQWRQIRGYPLYEVSTDGHVRRWTPPMHRNGVELPVLPKPSLTQSTVNGYQTVNLSIDGKAVKKYVHRLVLYTFRGEPPIGYEARHLDGDRTNNRLSNLQWGSRSENTLDKVRHGTHPMANKTHCKRDHEFDAENTYVDKKGYRTCKRCKRGER